MEEIKSVNFSQTLLIPAKGSMKEKYPKTDFIGCHFIGSFSGKSGINTSNTHVLLVNCNKIEELFVVIAGEINFLYNLLENELENEDLNEKYISERINYLSKIQDNISSGDFKKDPPDELINVVSRSLVRKKVEVEKEKVLFLSGVSSIQTQNN